jgi:hypothetical protein
MDFIDKTIYYFHIFNKMDCSLQSISIKSNNNNLRLNENQSIYIYNLLLILEFFIFLNSIMVFIN